MKGERRGGGACTMSAMADDEQEYEWGVSFPVESSTRPTPVYSRPSEDTARTEARIWRGTVHRRAVAPWEQVSNQELWPCPRRGCNGYLVQPQVSTGSPATECTKGHVIIET